MAVTELSIPLANPISLPKAKSWLRVEHDLEDDLVATLLEASTRHVETATGRILLARSFRQYVSPSLDRKNAVGNLEIKLECWPVLSVDALTAYDRAGNPTSIDPAGTRLNTVCNPAVLSLSLDGGLNAAANGLEIDFTCGHEASAPVPADLERAILVLLAHWYEFRGCVDPQDQPVSMPNGFDQLVAPYRKVRL